MAPGSKAAKPPAATASSSRDLKDHAATAALLVTRSPDKSGKKNPKGPLLDSEGKLSSASAALSLKHAQPRDLPSFPILGLANAQSSAGAAASLAAANQSTFEHWKPGAQPHASKAALLANDYKADAPWKPELSSAGSKAALLAHRKSGAKGTTEVYTTAAPAAAAADGDAPAATGSSAAGAAMRSKKAPQRRAPPPASREAWDGASWSMTAATGAFSGERHKGTMPPVPRVSDATSSAASALNAATKAHGPRPKRHASVPNDLPGMSAADARRIHAAAVTNMSRDMYTAAPPVAPEVEECNRQAGLNAAAVSMARKMYETQQRQGAAAAELAAARSSSAAAGQRKSESEAAADDLKGAAKQYLHLQDAARKLAAERLAKLNDDSTSFQSYYGQGGGAAPRRGVSLKVRKRASWAAGGGDADGNRAERIRAQTAGLGSKLAAVDEAKRQTDRAALLEAARRNVRQSMHGMDERVFADTGKASAAMQAEWEERARAEAKERSAARLESHGKVNIGGGKFLDQAEINAIAASRVQPTLDAITAKAEADRARDDAARRAEEQRRRDAEAKTREEKDRKRNTNQEWKRFKDDEKAEKRRSKDEAKARRAEEKKAQKERDEEAQWAAVRNKEHAKEEKAEEKRKAEENKKAEKDREAQMAAEFDAIREEEKRKESGDKQRQKEEKEAEKQRELGAASLDKVIHKHEKEEEEEAEETEKQRHEEEKEAEKEQQQEEKEAEEEAQDRDDAAQKVHELAVKIRQEAREAAVLQYLRQEEERVRHKQGAGGEGEEQVKEEQEQADKELEQKQKEAEKRDRLSALASLEGTPKPPKKEDGRKGSGSKPFRSSGFRSEPSRDDKDTKRKSRGALGLGAVAAAMGLGEREKKEQALDTHADSDASTSLESLPSSDDDAKGKSPKQAKAPAKKQDQQRAPVATVSTTIEATSKPESSRDGGKRTSWFRRLGSRSGSKSEKPSSKPAEPKADGSEDGVSATVAAMTEKTRAAMRTAYLAPSTSEAAAASASTVATSSSAGGSGVPGGKASISGPIHTRPIQNSTGFAALPAGGSEASAVLPPTAGTSTALEPGSPPVLCPPVELEGSRNDSERDLALAGREHMSAADQRRAARNLSRDSSDLDSSDDGKVAGTMSGPPGLPEAAGGSALVAERRDTPDEATWLRRAGEGDDEEEWEEARDRVGDDGPQVMPSVRAAAGSPSRPTRFREEL